MSFLVQFSFGCLVGRHIFQKTLGFFLRGRKSHSLEAYEGFSPNRFRHVEYCLKCSLWNNPTFSEFQTNVYHPSSHLLLPNSVSSLSTIYILSPWSNNFTLSRMDQRSPSGTIRTALPADGCFRVESGRSREDGRNCIPKIRRDIQGHRDDDWWS